MEDFLSLIPFVDVMIALAFIYAIVSNLVSALLEFLKGKGSYKEYHRGIFLKEGIGKLLDTGSNAYLLHRFYNHPIIVGQTKSLNRLPQYISAENFANVVVDVISSQAYNPRFSKNTDGELVLENSLVVEDTRILFLEGLYSLPESPAKDVIVALWNQVSSGLPIIERNTDQGFSTNLPFKINSAFEPALFQTLINQFKLSLANLYNDHTDRMEGWYKIQLRWPTLILSIIVVLVLNLDFFKILAFVEYDDSIRKKYVEQAYKADSANRAKQSLLTQDEPISQITNGDTTEPELSVNKKAIAPIQENRKDSSQLDTSYSLLKGLGLPIFWSSYSPPYSVLVGEIDKNSIPKEFYSIEPYFYNESKGGFWALLKWMIGIFISIVLVSRGAPFWFQILSKFINIRNGGKKPVVK